MFDLKRTKIIKLVNKVWGTEYWLRNDEHYCMKLLGLMPKHRCSMHYHMEKTETFLLFHGMILMEIDHEKPKIMNAGELIHIPPLTKHRFTGLVEPNSMILECSTFHEDSDSYRDEDSCKLTEEQWTPIFRMIHNELR